VKVTGFSFNEENCCFVDGALGVGRKYSAADYADHTNPSA